MLAPTSRTISSRTRPWTGTTYGATYPSQCGRTPPPPPDARLMSSMQEGAAGVVARTGTPSCLKSGRRKFRLRQWAPALVLLLMCVGLAIANPRFIGLHNLVRIVSTASVPLMIGVGETLIILLGSDDSNGHDFGWLAPLAAIGLTMLMGLVNGLVQTVLRIPSFMATLGMWFICLGAATTLLG